MIQEDKNKLFSGGGTLLFFALILLVCLAFGYDPPDPPIPEEGVEVNLGNSDMGYGNDPQPSPTEESAAPRPSSATEQVITQHHESTTPMYSSPKPSTAKTDNKTPTTTQPDPPKEPEVNKQALFPGSRKTTGPKGGSEGNTHGTGNMGKAGGDPNSSRYDGAPGQGGTGFSLSGRSARALPSPATTSNKQGKIVVKIWVDRNGVVTKTDAPAKGSTLTDAALVSLARQSAMKATFSKNSDAPETQVGTITYVFANN